MTRSRLALPAALCLAFACGTVEETPIVGGSGGSSAGGAGGQGGDSATGGASTGGVSATGGETATGGSTSTGGQDATGGEASGGSTSAGGFTGDGGEPASGGSDGSGGAPPGSGGAATGGSTSGGVCGGDTPHGCYVPSPNNPRGCPPQIHEQSSYFPPPDEWEQCSSPPLAACVYEKPDGGEAECRCNVGGAHWLCSY